MNMQKPMPMEGAAPAPKGPEAKEASPQKLQQLVMVAGGSLAELAEMMQSAGAPPELSDRAGALLGEFESLVKDMMNGGGAPKQPPSGPAAMQAGGNPRAVPV